MSGKFSNFIWRKFILLSWVFLFSCSEPDLPDQAIEIFEKNQTMQSDDEVSSDEIIRSSDGLQFTKKPDENNQSETVGLTKEGKVSLEGKFKDGKPHGTWITFFPDGRPRWKGNKKEGLSHGPYIMWYPNGKKKMEGSYKNGQKEGLSTIWHINGEKWKEQKHKLGKPVGIWKTWNDQGVLTEEINHDAIPSVTNID